MSAYGYMDTAVPGLLNGNRLDNVVAGTYVNADSVALNFGAPVFGYVGDSTNVYKFYLDTTKLVLSADLSASNVTTITVNGVAAAGVEYGTSHDATVTALLAALNTLTGVEAVADATDTDNRTILVRTKGATCIATGAVVGGSAVTVTPTQHSSQVFLGAAVFVQKLPTGYTQYEPVNILTKGRIWVTATKAVEAQEVAYVDNASTDISTFTNGTYGVAVGGVYRSNASAAGLAILEVTGQTKMTYASVF